MTTMPVPMILAIQSTDVFTLTLTATMTIYVLMTAVILHMAALTIL
jgi:hypothetical protein